MEIYSVSSATEYIIMKVPQKRGIYRFSVALAINEISTIIYLRVPDLECIFRGTWS